MEQKPNAGKEQAECQHAPEQKCLRLQILDQDRKIGFSKGDSSEGAKLTIHYLEPMECGPGTGSWSIPGTVW